MPDYIDAWAGCRDVGPTIPGTTARIRAKLGARTPYLFKSPCNNLQQKSGARDTIRLNKPIIFAEYLKCGLNPLSEWLEGQGYTVADIGGYNLLALPNEGANRLDDPRQVIEQLTKPPQQLPEAFNADVYLALHRDVRLSGIDPGTHYLGWGWREGRRYR